MYDDAMTAIHQHLLKRSMTENLLYTSELIPEHDGTGKSSVFLHLDSGAFLISLHRSWRLVPKQDHLVCFLGGSFLLGATDGAHAKVPPRLKDFTSAQTRDWNNGVELVKTCMATHDTRTSVDLFSSFIVSN